MKKNKLRKRKIIFILILASPFILFILLGFLSQASFLQIKEITVKNIKAIDNNEVTDYVKSGVSGRYLGLYSKRNIFIYPKRRMERDFVNRFPRSYSLELKIDRRLNMTASVKERSPFVLWCGKEEATYASWDGTNENELKEKCYLVDRQGFIFGEAPQYTGVVYPKFYVNISTDISEVPISKYVANSGNFYKIASYIDGLDKEKIKIQKIINVEKNYFEFYCFYGNTSNIFVVKIDLKNKPPIILSNLQSALQQSKLANLKKDNFSVLSYIDLRYEDRIYYK